MASGKLVSAESGNGLMSDGTKLLSEPMLTYAHRHPLTYIPGQCLHEYSRYQSPSYVWKCTHLKSKPHLHSHRWIFISDAPLCIGNSFEVRAPEMSPTDARSLNGLQRLAFYDRALWQWSVMSARLTYPNELVTAPWLWQMNANVQIKNPPTGSHRDLAIISMNKHGGRNNDIQTRMIFQQHICPTRGIFEQKKFRMVSVLASNYWCVAIWPHTRCKHPTTVW